MCIIQPTSILKNADKHDLSPRSWYQLINNVYPIADSQFNDLWNLHPPQRDEIMMFGRLVTIPRYQKLYGNEVEYRYSGKNLISEIVTNEVMMSALNWVNCVETEIDFNGMLVNWYENGKHYMGPHSDDERDLTHGAPIYSYSFGAERVFRIVNKATQEKTDILLKHGSLLIMGGRMQQEFKHALPARAKCKDPRVNLTIRSFTTQKT